MARERSMVRSIATADVSRENRCPGGVAHPHPQVECVGQPVVARCRQTESRDPGTISAPCTPLASHGSRPARRW